MEQIQEEAILKATRRRARQSDPLASRAAIKDVIKQLRAALPEIIPKSDKQLLSLLRAVLHAERHPEITTRRGRKSPWKDVELVKTAASLRAILERGTKRVGLRSFVEHYLLIPGFPEDVARALEEGKINLFEAEQLARLGSDRTGIPEDRIRKRRLALLRTHLQSGESGARLKARVDALLYHYQHPGAFLDPLPAVPQHSPEILAAAEQLEAEIAASHENPDALILDIAPDHFFYEYLRLIVSYMREIRPEEISDMAMERVMSLSEQLIQQLHAIHKQQHPPADEAMMEEARKSFHI
jgi:hypothetical protein